jgi:hypothetical protein
VLAAAPILVLLRFFTRTFAINIQRSGDVLFSLCNAVQTGSTSMPETGEALASVRSSPQVGNAKAMPGAIQF